MITLRNVHKSFGAQKVLDGLDLDIPDGKITAIIGPSGEGKSVLLKHLIGLLQPDSGAVEVDGESIIGLRRSELNRIREKFGMLFQNVAPLSALRCSFLASLANALPLAVFAGVFLFGLGALQWLFGLVGDFAYLGYFVLGVALLPVLVAGVYYSHRDVRAAS